MRSLDGILQSHFGRPLGLADPQTLILDPATGTGTFLYFVIQHIYDKLHSMGQAGSWNSYVQENLLPRLFGFELLMAPYAVAHLKLGVLLRELGYQFESNERLNVFLTNALSKPEVSAQVLSFAGFLSEEGALASEVKQGKPIMVVLGNPPYAGHSSNTGEWIVEKVRDYYKVDGAPLGERNPKWLQDDYVKFIRWAQWRIEETGRGVVAFVTNHGFLDNPTFRGMRQQLLQAFDEIYIMDLHGNSKKKEVSPNGSKDENVFDIQQGVAIGLFIKTSSSTEPAKLSRIDLWGVRSAKYNQLFEENFATASWQTVEPKAPFYLFLAQDGDIREEYQQYASFPQIAPTNVLGFQTHRDGFAIDFQRDEIVRRIVDLRNPALSDDLLRERYELRDNRDWQLSKARQTLQKDDEWQKPITLCAYRPFDWRYCYFSTNVMDYPRRELVDHVAYQQNLCLLISRQQANVGFRHVWVATNPANDCVVSATSRESNQVFPLYTYTTAESTQGTLFATDTTTRQPNLAPAFIAQVAATLGLEFTIPEAFAIQPPTPAGQPTFTPEDIFYYAYALFHSPTYRTRYAEFLKIDFPRLPLTASVPLFRQLALLGHQLVQLHLLTSPALHTLQTRFPQGGSNSVEKGHPRYVEPTASQGGRVYINKTQFFEGVEPSVWEMQIGGYQPLQKWLKDRIGRTLSFDELMHYQRIALALAQTQQHMQTIDGLLPTWPLA